jgi:hypothetical protein
MTGKIGNEEVCMVKPTKYLRKQAAKAERTAGRIRDPEISAEMRALADAYRSQAETLEREKSASKKGSTKASRAD